VVQELEVINIDMPAFRGIHNSDARPHCDSCVLAPGAQSSEIPGVQTHDLSIIAGSAKEDQETLVSVQAHWLSECFLLPVISQRSNQLCIVLNSDLQLDADAHRIACAAEAKVESVGRDMKLL